METIAKICYLRIAPRKVRLVADMIRGKNVEEAQNLLDFTVKKANLPIAKLLDSAIASAKNNFQLEKSNLFISKIFVDEGPTHKRWRARARGRAGAIKKRTSHITVVLNQIIEKKIKIKKIKKIKENKDIKGLKKIENKKISKINKIIPRSGFKVQKTKKDQGVKKIFRRKAF